MMVLAVSPARDQTALRDAVNKRPRPEFESHGLSLHWLYSHRYASALARFASSFDLFTRAELDVGHTSNLFRTSSDQTASRYVTFKPAIGLRSDWENHDLGLSLKVDSTRYTARSSENTDDISMRLSGRMDMTELTRLSGVARIGRFHLERGNDSDPGPDSKPLTYSRFDLGVVYDNLGNEALAFSAKVDWTAVRFDDKNGVSNDNLDRNIMIAEGKIGLSDGGPVDYYLQPTLEVIDYRSTPIVDSDSLMYGLAVGTDLQWSDDSQLEGRVGFQFRDFADQSLDDQFGLNLVLNGVWNPTALLSLSTTALVANQDSQEEGASSKTLSKLEFRADYEPIDAVILGASIAYDRESFEGLDRTDELYRYKMEAKYLINEHLYLGGELRYEDQSSDVSAQEYDETRIMFRIGAKLCCLTEQGVTNAFH